LKLLPPYLLLLLPCAAVLAACSEGTSPKPTPAVTVTSVSPNNGALAGGTAVTITGANFVNVTAVTIGGATLQNLSVVSSTQITGLTPASSTAGTVAVTVYSTSAGTGACGCFTYNPAVTVSGVSPTSGPLVGGTAVTITGTNFVNVTGVTVGGGALQNLSVVSSTQITGLTPASASSGAKDVSVSSSSHGSGTCTACFTYNPALTVSSVSPNNGPLAGGTAVTITGTNFPMTVDSMRVGTGWLGSLVRANGTQLTGITPSGKASGAVDVTVYTTSEGSGTCTGCFTYNPGVTWTSASLGAFHTCGLTSSGTAYCWGSNQYGGLGDGSTTQRLTPVAVAGGITFASLTAGSLHTCGLTSGGAAYCWGINDYGELGDGSTVNRFTPVAVAGGLTFATLVADGQHTCGLTIGRAAYCWGRNQYDQLGDSSATNRLIPVAVVGGLTFTSLTAGGDHTCGLTSGGAAYCWGYNVDGRIGDGSTTNRATPVAVAGGITFGTLTAGGGHTCGLTSSGAAYCWGYNGSGNVGDGSTTDRHTPVAVVGGLTLASLTASRGGSQTCGLTSGGAAYCWGFNLDGELGDGSTTNRYTPVAVASP
jgi:alpha-tubulin suppressor-like RCC1 family protein